MDVLAIQTAPKAQGFDPGALDGVWGRNTIRAVKEFQRTRGLSVDGVVGPITADVLFANSPAPPDISGLVWIDEARRLMGTREVRGRGSNQNILDWGRARQRMTRLAVAIRNDCN